MGLFQPTGINLFVIFPLFSLCHTGEAQAVALQSFLQQPCSWAEVVSIEKKRWRSAARFKENPELEFEKGWYKWYQPRINKPPVCLIRGVPPKLMICY